MQRLLLLVEKENYSERRAVAVVVPLVGTFRPPGLQHPLWSDPQVVAWRVAAGQSRRDQAG